MSLQLSCVPFTVTRFVARTFAENCEPRLTEAEARADARRLLRSGWGRVDVFRVQWDPVTGIRGGRQLVAIMEASPAS